MDYIVSLAYASLGAATTLLQRLLACLNFTLESEEFFSLVQTKKVISMNMAAAQAGENHGYE